MFYCLAIYLCQPLTLYSQLVEVEAADPLRSQIPSSTVLNCPHLGETGVEFWADLALKANWSSFVSP
ncbi:MAG: hypothetical protein SW833_07995 [Cyanobacteriota bacterium]|nr:hypothetical protein [Cyanobacteriota bacterium]